MVLMKHLNYDVCDYINNYAMNDHLIDMAKQRIIDDYEDTIKNSSIHFNDVWRINRNPYALCSNVIMIEINKIGHSPIYLKTYDEITGQKDMDIIQEYMKLMKTEIASVLLYGYYEFIDGEGLDCYPSYNDGELIRYDKIDNYDDYKTDELKYHWETSGQLYNYEETQIHKAYMLNHRIHISNDNEWFRQNSREDIAQYIERHDLDIEINWDNWL